MKYPKKYLPNSLNKKDKLKQKKALKKAREGYKKQKYIDRPKVDVKNKESPHIVKAKNIYKVDKIVPNKKLADKTGCSISGLKQVIKKGEGAYYSSGSRPNQTARSWGLARLASTITGGKAAAVDFHILEKMCTPYSKALKLAKASKKKHGYGTRRVPKTKGGGKKTQKLPKMKEKIIKFKKGPFPKKYTAFIKNNKTQKQRVIHFGDSRYPQFKDRTPLKLYAHKNHNTRKRMQNYYSRHSGTPNRKKAIIKERKVGKGLYTAKILSHEYLW
jgi:DNA-binding Xre family transcriptional regulator